MGQNKQNKMKDPETWVDEHGDSLFRYALFRIQDAQVAERWPFLG
jgi:hypothetical protein